MTWTMPAWMESHRDLIGNTGGNTIESLMNDTTTTAQNNLIRAALVVSVESQIGLLARLHARGRLIEDRPARTGQAAQGEAAAFAAPTAAGAPVAAGAPAQGDVICGAEAEACRCALAPGHADTVPHARGRDGCGGSWTGAFGGSDFDVISFPGIGGVS